MTNGAPGCTSVQGIAIAPTAPSDLFATIGTGGAGPGGEVAVWSLAARAQVARFPVEWELGGRRLAVLADHPARVISAAYDAHGVSAYTLDGQRAWHRQDLTKIQRITPFRYGGREYLALVAAAGPLTIVDAKSGETSTRLIGAKELFVGEQGVRLQVLSGAVLLESETPPRARRIALESFAVLDAAFSEDAVAFSEAGGALRCFSIDGAARWELEFRRGTTHALEIAWNAAHRRWLAVVWNHLDGGPHWLCRIDPSGAEVGRDVLEPCLQHRLSKAGDVVVIGGGRVLDPLRNEVLFDFRSDAAPVRASAER